MASRPHVPPDPDFPIDYRSIETSIMEAGFQPIDCGEKEFRLILKTPAGYLVLIPKETNFESWIALDSKYICSLPVVGKSILI